MNSVIKKQCRSVMEEHLLLWDLNESRVERRSVNKTAGNCDCNYRWGWGER